MPTSLTFEQHGAGIGNAATVLRANASATDLATPVPTCPGWTVLDLVAHQGMVHRWAAHVVETGDLDPGTDLEAEGRAAEDVLRWFDDGATALLQVLASAPPDLDVPFFLKDAPAPREAWARRQCHETTIHAVDALAARLGRPPVAAQTWLRPALAVDGLDELLLGFLPRRRSRLRRDTALTIAVEPTDAAAAWTVHVDADPPRATVGSDGCADVTLRGTAVQLYLALWNRGDEVEDTTGSADVLAQWREQVTTTWE